jgi:hypothetical protein
MRISTLGVATVVFVAAILAATVAAPMAAASALSFCDDLGGQWDGQYCHTSVRSERNAVRDIKVAIPAEVVDDPVAGPVVRQYLTTLVDNWRRVGTSMAADSFGEANYEILRRGNTVSAVFRETYHADGPDFNNAYRTFTFDTSAGRQLQLSDLTRPGVDPLTAIPPLAQPFVEQALDQAPPAHQPGTYPFVVDRWTPDKVYSGAYKAWALTGDELVIYMPDYPVARDTPIDFTPGVMKWAMDGGTVKARIPLAALSSVLRPEFTGG